MTARISLSPAALAELHALPDEARLTTAEAGAFLNVSPNTLMWYRCHRMGPDYMRVGPKSIRYLAGALRSYSASLAAGVGRPKVGG
jgi:hypothetical protein